MDEIVERASPGNQPGNLFMKGRRRWREVYFYIFKVMQLLESIMFDDDESVMALLLSLNGEGKSSGITMLLKMYLLI